MAFAPYLFHPLGRGYTALIDDTNDEAAPYSASLWHETDRNAETMVADFEGSMDDCIVKMAEYTQAVAA